MRKTLAGLLAATMVLTMVGCGSSGDSSNTEENNTQTEANTQEEAAVELLKANAMIAKATQQCLAPARNAFEQLDDTKEIINKHITF